MNDDTREDRELWSAKAEGWHRQIGEHGDRYRRNALNHWLFSLMGDVSGLRVLDAGCGTGYLAIKLARAGAHVVAVDYADGMLAQSRANVARAGVPVDVRQDDCCELATVEPGSIDLVVSNFVLQDLADHRAAARAFRRVLTDTGRAVLLFGHPVFSGLAQRHDDGTVTVELPFAYFDEVRCEEVWRGTDHETGELFDFPGRFTYYHRPLSSYWRAFREAGFRVLDFDEPVQSAATAADMTPEDLRRSRQAAWSVVFHLQAEGGASA